MDYLGDFAEDATVYFAFSTSDGSGGAVAPSSALEAADVVIYKNNSATQKTSTNGVTMTSPFDSVTGLHFLTIDTSNDTGDSGFWETGSDYTVVLTPDETVDSQTIVSVLGQFSIQNRYKAVDAPVKNAALNNIPFYMVDSTDHITPETGLSITAQVSLDGAALGAAAGTVTEIGNGLYHLDAAAADMNGDLVVFRFTATGADPALISIKTVTQ